MIHYSNFQSLDILSEIVVLLIVMSADLFKKFYYYTFTWRYSGAEEGLPVVK